jgi:hypothetical protein
MKETDWIEKPNGISECYVFDSDTPHNRHLAYIIDDNKKKNTFIPEGNFAVEEVLLDGFDELPDEFSAGRVYQRWLDVLFAKKVN